MAETTQKIYATIYTYDPERSEDLARLRPQHREFLRSLFDAGKLLASGPYADGKALIVVRADSADGAYQMLDPDPLNEAHIILHREASEWKPVIGPWD